MLGIKVNKNVLLITALLLAALFLNLKLISSLGSLRSDLKRERQARLNIEGNLKVMEAQRSSLAKEKKDLQESVKSLEADLEQERFSLKSTQESLQNSENANKYLSARLEQAKSLADYLEKDLKAALLRCRPKAKK